MFLFIVMSTIKILQKDVLSPRTFPSGGFISGTFCPEDVLFRGRFARKTNCPWNVLLLDDVLSPRMFCLGNVLSEYHIFMHVVMYIFMFIYMFIVIYIFMSMICFMNMIVYIHIQYCILGLLNFWLKLNNTERICTYVKALPATRTSSCSCSFTWSYKCSLFRL